MFDQTYLWHQWWLFILSCGALPLYNWLLSDPTLTYRVNYFPLAKVDIHLEVHLVCYRFLYGEHLLLFFTSSDMLLHCGRWSKAIMLKWQISHVLILVHLSRCSQELKWLCLGDSWSILFKPTPFVDLGNSGRQVVPSIPQILNKIWMSRGGLLLQDSY